MMDASFVEAIVGAGHPTSVARVPIIKVDDQSDRRFLFDDKEGKYLPLERVVVRSRRVSNIESFVALVIEESRRRDNPTGHFGTVSFSTTGGHFSPDERVALDSFNYIRKLSPQWAALMAALGKPLMHADFIRVLQGLRPSFDAKEYPLLMREFRKVSFDSRTNLVSAPVLTNGKAGSTFEFTIEVKGGGQAETAIPSGFRLALPFARGSAAQYYIDVELDAQMVEREGKKSVAFVLLCPHKEETEERAVNEEVKLFANTVQVAGLNELLILNEY